MNLKKLKDIFGTLVTKVKGDGNALKNDKVEPAVPPAKSTGKTPQKMSTSGSVKVDIFSPCDGELIPQKDIPDEGFAEPHMGVGVGIKPSSPSVASFMSGELVVLFKTKHAYIIKDQETGISAMLHLGIDTVNIEESKGAFSTNRKQGDILKAKDALCEMNLEVIEKEAKSTVSALIVQHDNMENRKIVHQAKPGPVKKGDLLMSVVSA